MWCLWPYQLLSFKINSGDRLDWCRVQKKNISISMHLAKMIQVSGLKDGSGGSQEIKIMHMFQSDNVFSVDTRDSTILVSEISGCQRSISSPPPPIGIRSLFDGGVCDNVKIHPMLLLDLHRQQRVFIFKPNWFFFLKNDKKQQQQKHCRIVVYYDILPSLFRYTFLLDN